MSQSGCCCSDVLGDGLEGRCGQCTSVLLGTSEFCPEIQIPSLSTSVPPSPQRITIPIILRLGLYVVTCTPTQDTLLTLVGSVWGPGLLTPLTPGSHGWPLVLLLGLVTTTMDLPFRELLLTAAPHNPGCGTSTDRDGSEEEEEKKREKDRGWRKQSEGAGTGRGGGGRAPLTFILLKHCTLYDCVRAPAYAASAGAPRQPLSQALFRCLSTLPSPTIWTQQPRIPPSISELAPGYRSRLTCPSASSRTLPGKE